MFHKVLIANRGEIACRVLRTLKRLEVRSVAVCSEADVHAQHVRLADEHVALGPPQVAESYLRIDRVIEAAQRTGAEAIHPGYGFLSESPVFAAACAEAGVRFVGPTADQLRCFGLKHEARALALRVGVPLLPGTELLETVEHALVEAERIGYPVMLKSTAGGGGIGLRACRDAAALHEAFEAVTRLSKNHFQGSGVFLEKLVEAARHVEVQVFGDGRGRVLALGERDCSAQRRNQKVIEETPAPGLSQATRAALSEAAISLLRAVCYESTGTVEFVLDARTERFYFLEVNTRLQVEHTVTEEVTGLDLVEWMLKQAAGELQLPAVAPQARGVAIQARVYAEDPGKGFQPSTGTLTNVVLAAGARTDTFVEAGLEITPYYDPLLAKVIVHGADREQARARLSVALAETRLDGLETNLAYLRALVADDTFARGELTTRYLQTFAHTPRAIDVLEGGTQSTVQDWPGRLGLWAVGVPPSGPVDDHAFRFANRLVGNPEGTPALELTLSGPKLQIRSACVIALTGADMGASVNGAPLARWTPVEVEAGAVLELGLVRGGGMRAYLAVRGGLDVPRYLGSAATFMLGRFGGHGGRALRAGDVLHVGEASLPAVPPLQVTKPEVFVPAYPEDTAWQIGVLSGPHGAPDFFTPRDLETFFATDWEVHYNSDRTGVRLIGPKPEWARKDGGEAGLHPSNLHDNAYAVGTVDFTGDMPIILGPDGPSLGGFVCPVTIAADERWKMGQLSPGARVRFVKQSAVDAILGGLDASGPRPRVVYRRAGDEYLLVEYGPLELDLALRLRAHALMTALEARAVAGIVDLTPGIRSLQIHYVPSQLPLRELLALLERLEHELPGPNELEIPSRIVHLPLSWEDPATLLAIEKYMRVVREDAPWCPSNLEFIRRINGLASVDDVRRIVFDASYLVLGLGDVYLGAPVATPLDPRHRLVTTKYNPARTWTPENAVGIGGAYLCIYGMEGPGGYQFVGRTLQVWNTWRSTPDFAPGKPWLLRFFDQLRFYPVEADELLRMREDFPQGKLALQIEHETFRFDRYQAFLTEHASSIAAFKSQQGAAFVAERERWRASGQDLVSTVEPVVDDDTLAATLPPGTTAISSPVAGSLWKLLVEPGQRVEPGMAVAIVEAMKTEITVQARVGGRVRECRVQPGKPVTPGQTLIVLERAD